MKTELMTTAIEHEPVTIERLEKGLALLAYLIVLDGPVLAPLFEKLERELAAMRQAASAATTAPPRRSPRW